MTEDPMSGSTKLSGLARLSAHTIRDYSANPVAKYPDDIPWCAEALTPQWLTPVLCSQVQNAVVRAVAVEDASTGSSVRKRIGVTYNDAGQRAGLKTKFFAKTTPTILTRLTSGPSAAQESNFFARIRPALDIETPTHIYSANDRISGRSIHLFEDLVDTVEATFCDYRTTFGEAQLAGAFNLLARLHGHFFGAPELESEHGWIPSYPVFFDALARTGTRDGHEQARNEARHLIPDRVADNWQKLWPAAVAGRNQHNDYPQCVIHSDLHPGNWYLTGSSEPGLCDWQCIARGLWARDFAYAMSTLVDVAERRSCEYDVLKNYLQALYDAGGPQLNFEEAKALYHSQLPGVLLMWTPTLCHPATMPDMQPEDVSMEMIHRITTAIDDHGVIE